MALCCVAGGQEAPDRPPPGTGASPAEAADFAAASDSKPGLAALRRQGAGFLFSLAHSTGAVQIERIIIAGLVLTDVRGRVTMVTDRKGLLREVTAKLYGGQVTGQAELELDDEKGLIYRVAAKFQGAKLEAMAADLGFEELSGTVSGYINIQGESARDEAFGGDGAVDLDEGSLGELPLILGLFTFVSAPKMKNVVIERARLRFTIGPEAVTFQRADFYGRRNVVKLIAEADGTWRHADGALDLRFRPEFKSRVVGKIPLAGPILKKVLDKVEGRSLRVRVTGTSKQPKYSWAPLK